MADGLTFTNRPKLVMIALRDARLSMTARVVLAELLDHRNPNDAKCDPSMARIGRRIGRSERNVRNAVAELERAGYVSTRRRRGTCFFTFHLTAFERANDRQKSTDQVAADDRQDSTDHKRRRSDDFDRSDRSILTGLDRTISTDKPLKGNHQREHGAQQQPLYDEAESDEDEDAVAARQLDQSMQDLKRDLLRTCRRYWPNLGTSPTWAGLEDLAQIERAEGADFRRFLINAVAEVAQRTADSPPAALRYAVKRVEDFQRDIWPGIRRRLEAEDAAHSTPPSLNPSDHDEMQIAAFRAIDDAQVRLLERALAEPKIDTTERHQ